MLLCPFSKLKNGISRALPARASLLETANSILAKRKEKKKYFFHHFNVLCADGSSSSSAKCNCCAVKSQQPKGNPPGVQQSSPAVLQLCFGNSTAKGCTWGGSLLPSLQAARENRIKYVKKAIANQLSRSIHLYKYIK